MRLQYHPKLVNIKDKWNNVHLVTGKPKPLSWSALDQRNVASAKKFLSRTGGKAGVTEALNFLYTKHLETWKKFTYFSRSLHGDLPSAFKKACLGEFCKYCGKVFARKDVCGPCTKSSPEAKQLAKDLAYKRSSETWQARPEEFKARKKQAIAKARDSWTDEQRAALSLKLKQSNANTDQVAKFAKIRKTLKQKTGVDNPSKDPSIQEKKRQNQLNKYGVDHHFRRPEIAEKLKVAFSSKTKDDWKKREQKSKMTRVSRTGFDHNMRDPSHIETRELASVSRWGFSNPASHPNVRLKIQDTWETRYGYREIFADPTVQAKSKATMLRRYGCENAMGYGPFIKKIQDYRKQRVVIDCKVYYVDSNPEKLALFKLVARYSKVLTQYSKGFPHISDRFHSAKSWLPDFYLPNEDVYIEIKSDYTLFHGNAGVVFFRNQEKARQTPNCVWLVYLAQTGRWVRLPKDWYKLRFTEVSKFLAERAHKKSKQAFIEAVANHMGPSACVEGNFIRSGDLSVFCATLVEHNSDEVDRNFLSNISNKSGSVILWDSDWALRRTVVKKFLDYKLGRSKFSLGARKTDVSSSKLTSEDREFFRANHLQGAPQSGKCFRLTYEGRTVAAMVFSRVQSVRGSYSVEGEYELSRFATVGNVAGAASKLFSAFVSEHAPTLVLSYSDNQHFNGKMYETLGFVKDQNVRSSVGYKSVWSFLDYWTQAKQATKRSALSKFDGFDPRLSEAKNAASLGLPRIYDCGKTKWIYR